MNRGEEVIELGNRVRCRTMAARFSVSIALFLHAMRIRLRFDGPVTAMRLNVREGFLFQPTQRIRAARAIGENRFHPRIGSEFLVEAFAESAQSK